jgi:tryptophanyl-tRNA synthetase
MTLDTVATILACEISPDKTNIFLQSSVKQHTELMWILSCVCPLHLLNKMIQFKEAKREKLNFLHGLYTYPILMAADILLYK